MLQFMKKIMNLEEDRQFKAKGYTFDMGQVGIGCQMFSIVSVDLINLIRLLQPQATRSGFQIVFNKENVLPIPASWPSVLRLFDNKEKVAQKSSKNL